MCKGAIYFKQKFIEETQSVICEPDRRFNAYPVINAPKIVWRVDPSKDMAGNMLCFVLALGNPRRLIDRFSRLKSVG